MARVAQEGAHTRVPTQRELTADARQLEAEFGNIQYDRKLQKLSVRTEPIELEGVYLGDFQIQLNLEDLSDVLGYPEQH